MSIEREVQEIAWLKKVFAAQMSSEEDEILEQMAGSEAGEALREQALRTKRLLSEIADVKLNSPSSEGMLRRFEEHIRRDAKEFRRRFVPFCLVVFGMCFLTGLLPVVFEHPRHGMYEIVSLWIILAIFGALVCSLMYRHNRRLLTDQNVTGYLRQFERRTPKTVAGKFKSVIILVLCAMLLARRYGWLLATVGTVAVLGILLLLSTAGWASLKRQRLKQDRELWDWWYEEPPRPDA